MQSLCPTTWFQKETFQRSYKTRNSLRHVPHNDHLILWYNEGTHQVKIATHAKIDKGFNNLPVDNLPLNCHQILHMNGTHVTPDKDEIKASDLDFLSIHFLRKKLQLSLYSLIPKILCLDLISMIGT